MFTGIVQCTGTVKSIETRNNFKHFCIEIPRRLIDGLEMGASIANNGVCLTVVGFKSCDNERAEIEFDVIDETLKLTNLAEVCVGSQINIERSMKVGDEIGGHIVSGHIHGTATLLRRIDSEDNCQLDFSLASSWAKYLFHKGFIAINGASLTLGKVVEQADHVVFSLHLIPETLQRTNLGALSVGESVNIEIDQQTITIVDSIERIMAKRN
ncbi:riboflavin synthase subunit alpha [Thalassotalea aquiviva]|uniref:riboflavin synthase subunit alpha n=1 Tax=Thalassotalea aquiviva TaxID=3242415 RepID=UPI00352BAA99